MASTDVATKIKPVDNPSVLINANDRLRKAKINDEILNSIRKYYEDTPINALEVREKIYDLSLQLDGIVPVELNKIGTLHVEKNYSERGMVIKMPLETLKQAWLEYRLIYNEKNKSSLEKEFKVEEKREEVRVMEEATSDSYVLNNFDDLFDKLSQKVSGAGRYIDDLEQMRREATSSNQALEQSRRSFERDKLSFEDVMKAEREKIETMKEQLEEDRRAFEQKKKEEMRKIQDEKIRLSEHYERLQKLTDEFNAKISKITE